MEVRHAQDDTGGISRRKPWLSVLLALLFSSFAFVYCGRLRRALGWQVFLWMCVFPLAATIMFCVPNGKIAIYGGTLILLGSVVSQIVDALLITSKARHSFR